MTKTQMQIDLEMTNLSIALNLGLISWFEFFERVRALL